MKIYGGTVRAALVGGRYWQQNWKKSRSNKINWVFHAGLQQSNSRMGQIELIRDTFQSWIISEQNLHAQTAISFFVILSSDKRSCLIRNYGVRVHLYDDERYCGLFCRNITRRRVRVIYDVLYRDRVNVNIEMFRFSWKKSTVESM